jgi:hypothetical protein
MEVPSKTVRRSQRENQTSSRTLRLLENSVLNIKVSSNRRSVSLQASNLVAHRIAIRNETRYNTYNYTLYQSSDDNLTNSHFDLGKSSESEAAVFVSIPGSVFLQAKSLHSQGNDLPFVIIVYKNDSLFSTKQLDNSDFKINSKVVSVSFSNSSLSGLAKPIKIQLEHTDKCTEEPQCVYWNSTPKGGSWSREGCSLVSTTDSHTNCECNHLTNFALLMNVNGPNRPNCIGKTHKLALSIITYVGCSLSLIALVLTVVTLTIFPQQLKTRPNKILINLCLALIGLLVVFLVGIDRTSNQPACKAVGAFIHYFTLSALLWMGIEAFNLYLLLVLVFSRNINYFILKCCLVGWGVPALIIGITVGQSTDNYGGTEYCLVTQPASFIALLAPAGLILLTNFILFILVVKVMCCSQRRHTIRKNEDYASQLRAAFSVVVLLGLTWVFGFLAVSYVSLVFQYLFALFNTTQGLFIFIFYCLRRKDMRNQWSVFLRGRGRHSVSRANQITQNHRSMSKSATKPSTSSLVSESVMSIHSVSTTRSTNIKMLMPSDEAKSRKYSLRRVFGKICHKKKNMDSVGDILHELHRLEGSGLSNAV